ncbi:MAG: FAD-dependent thymidylate synthase [Clostridia bacterium]|nr:FAD-dependent thymidylate synthase [Clostridia bacterium]
MGKVIPKVELLRHTYNAEEIVAMAAKLCYSDADIETIQKGVEKKDQGKYIKMLVEMGHMSVIEHVSFTFGIEGVSRSFLAQATRHRLASFSVKSQRYVGQVKAAGETFNYVIPPQIEALGKEAVKEYENQMKTLQQWYNGWVDRLGDAGESTYEDARFVLPNSAETKMILTMNARELRHFFSIRCCNRAQWEIRDVAWQMLKLCKESARELFENAGPGCVGGKCTEGSKSCMKQKEVRERAGKL